MAGIADPPGSLVTDNWPPRLSPALSVFHARGAPICALNLLLAVGDAKPPTHASIQAQFRTVAVPVQIPEKK